MSDPNDNMAVAIAAGLRDAAAQFEALTSLLLEKINTEKDLLARVEAGNKMAARLAAALRRHARVPVVGLPYDSCACCRRITGHDTDCEIGAVLSEVLP